MLAYFHNTSLQTSILVLSLCAALQGSGSAESTNLETVASASVGPESSTPLSVDIVTTSKPSASKNAVAWRSSLREAGLSALQNNPSFSIQRLNPQIQREAIVQQEAVFDPKLSASLALTHATEDQHSLNSGNASDTEGEDDGLTIQAGLSQRYKTGTSVSLGLSTQRGDASLTDTDTRTHSVDVTITQSLLRGYGKEVNTVRLRQADLDVDVSRYTLKAAAESLLYQVESTGWDVLLAERQIKIYESSLKLSEDQLAEVKERIRIGALADIEQAATEAEVAKARENLINARSQLAKLHLEFLRLLGVRGAQRWARDVILSDTPEVPADELAPIDEHLAVALKERPDLNEARLQLQSQQLSVVQTRNGMLPQLDFFVRLGGSRYASSFRTGDTDRDGTELSAGLNFEMNLGRNSERSAHQVSRLGVTQSQEALRNQEDLATVDVQTAYLEVNRSYEQIAATQATLKHQKEAFRAETEKFRVGKSTSILVAQAQQNLVASQLSEIEAVVSHLKARLNLYRQEGSLLQRRGVELGAL